MFKYIQNISFFHRSRPRCFIDIQNIQKMIFKKGVFTHIKNRIINESSIQHQMETTSNLIYGQSFDIKNPSIIALHQTIDTPVNQTVISERKDKVDAKTFPSYVKIKCTDIYNKDSIFDPIDQSSQIICSTTNQQYKLESFVLSTSQSAIYKGICLQDNSPCLIVADPIPPVSGDDFMTPERSQIPVNQSRVRILIDAGTIYNNIRYLDFIAGQEYTYLVIEDVVGMMQLNTFLDKYYEVLTESQVFCILKQICLAVAHLHSKGAFHNDIGIDNVCVTFDEKGIIKILLHKIEFTINKNSYKEGSRHPEPADQIRKSPEIIRYEMGNDDIVDLCQSDIWCLGILFFIVLSGGKHPFLENEQCAFTIRDTDYLKIIYTPANKITPQKVPTNNQLLAQLVSNMLVVRNKRPNIIEVCKVMLDVYNSIA